MIQLIRSNSLLAMKLFLAIIYLVGIAGMIQIPDVFTALTPLNLLLCSLVLFGYHENKNKDFWRFALLVFAAGFAIEMLGVSTGKIFGSYYYGETLGLKIKGTPLIIGLNWLFLTYCTGTMARRFTTNIFVCSLVGALLMVIYDFLLEQYAPIADFWHFQNNHIPAQNYIAWFILGYFFNLLYFNFKFDKINPLAFFLFSIQFLFFIVLNLYNYILK